MYSGVISIFSERIAKSLPINIYGDGQQTRDFVNVADVVQANLLAMSSSAKCLAPNAFSIFNIAAGCQTSRLQLLGALGEICGVNPDVSFSPSRSGDIQHSLADISKVRNILGYTPGVELKEGLGELVSF